MSHLGLFTAFWGILLILSSVSGTRTWKYRQRQKVDLGTESPEFRQKVDSNRFHRLSNDDAYSPTSVVNISRRPIRRRRPSFAKIQRRRLTERPVKTSTEPPSFVLGPGNPMVVSDYPFESSTNGYPRRLSLEITPAPIDLEDPLETSFSEMIIQEVLPSSTTVKAKDDEMQGSESDSNHNSWPRSGSDGIAGDSSISGRHIPVLEAFGRNPSNPREEALNERNPEESSLPIRYKVVGKKNQVLISNSNDVIDFSRFTNVDEELLAMESDGLGSDSLEKRFASDRAESERNNVRLSQLNTIDLLSSMSTSVISNEIEESSDAGQIAKRKLNLSGQEGNQIPPRFQKPDLETGKQYEVRPTIRRLRQKTRADPKVQVVENKFAWRHTTLSPSPGNPLNFAEISTSPPTEATATIRALPGRRLDYLQSDTGPESIKMKPTASHRSLLAGMDLPVNFASQSGPKRGLSRKQKQLKNLFNKHFMDLENTLRVNTIPHLISHVKPESLNTQPKMEQVGSGQKLSQKQFYVYYVTLIEIQRILERLLRKQMSPDMRLMVMDVSGHNIELMKLFFKHIVITDRAKKVVLSRGDARTFRTHFNAVRQIFPFL